MVYHCQHTHIYQYPFQKYLQTELNQRLEVTESYKTSVDVIEKATDPIDGNQRILLKTTWKNVIPEILRQDDSLNVDEIEFEEEFWIAENQGYWRRCRNVTLDNLLQIWQASSCSKDNNNDNWTYSEEEGGIEVFSKDKLAAVLENVMGQFINNSIETNIERTERMLAEQHSYSSGNSD